MTLWMSFSASYSYRDKIRLKMRINSGLTNKKNVKCKQKAKESKRFGGEAVTKVNADANSPLHTGSCLAM